MEWSCSKSISSGAQYVTLQKYFSHPNLSYLLFSDPTHKTKTRTTNSNHLDESNYLANQKQGEVKKYDLTKNMCLSVAVMKKKKKKKKIHTSCSGTGMGWTA